MNINRHGIPILLHQHRKVRPCFKLRHATRDEAFDHLVKMEVKFGEQGLNVYRCRWCKQFHIGHVGKDKR